MLVLKRSPEQEAAAVALVDDLHNRNSANYHQWLTPEEFGRRFGPSDSDLHKTTEWLKSKGFAVEPIAPGRTHLTISGTAGQLRAAFRTSLHRLNVNGELHIAAMRDPEIPAALSPVIAGIHQLHDWHAKPMSHTMGAFRRNALTGESEPLAGTGSGPEFTFTNYSTLWAVTPQDWYTIYNSRPLYQAGITGAGTTIAVMEETAVAHHDDVTAFRSQFGLPAYPVVPNAAQGGVNWLEGPGNGCNMPARPTSTGEEAEALLDVEWAGAIAPNATIDFVACGNSTTNAGIDLAASYVANYLYSTVSAASLSYGGCETMFGADMAYYHGLWQQMAAEGITVVVSSGDWGSMGCDAWGSAYATHELSTNALSSSPYNISAGGTDFSDTYQSLRKNDAWWSKTNSFGYSSALSYIPEMTWGSFCANPVYASYLEKTGATDYGTDYTPMAICNAWWAEMMGLAEPLGGGGGISQYIPLPSWQGGVYGIGNASTSTTFRNEPDLSFFASSGAWAHYMPFCQSDSGYSCDYSDVTNTVHLGAGGTSFVAPQIAGLMALINQYTGTRQGVANYTLYGLAAAEYGTPDNPNTTNLANCSGSGRGAAVDAACIFRDIAGDTPSLQGGTITTNIAQPCLYSSVTNCYGSLAQTLGLSAVGDHSSTLAYETATGYDLATGLGSANLYNLVMAWNSALSFPSTITLSADTNSVVGATGTVTLTATVTATGRGGQSPPSGTVAFYSGSTSGTLLGSATLGSACNGSGACSATASLAVAGMLLASGNNSLIAYFGGDGASDAPATSAAVNVSYAPLSGTDLAISKSHNGSFVVGQTGAVYTLTVRNLGGSASSGAVTVTDVLPAGLAATAIGGDGWNCTLSPPACSRADSLAAGGSYPGIALTVSVTAGAPGLLTNTAAVSGGGDSNSSNNTASDATAIVTLASGPVIVTVAGNGTAGYNGDNGPAPAAALNQPWGAATDSLGNLYIADTYGHRIRKVDALSGLITTVAGNGTAGFNGDGGAATAANLNYPTAVAVDIGGNLYIADYNNDRIRMVSAATGTITTVAGTGIDGDAGDGGFATAAQLRFAGGLAVDGRGNLYIADTYSHRIRRIDAASKMINTVAGTGTAGYSGDGGAATAAQLNLPGAVALDNAGNLYIADTANHRIRRIAAADGVITTVAGSGIAGSSGDNGPALTAALNAPTGVAVDATGNLYIADYGNNRIRLVNAATGSITTAAGSGVAGYSGDGGPAVSAQINTPLGVAVDAGGKWYVADTGNNRVRAVTTSVNTRTASNVNLTTSANPTAPASAVTFTATVSAADSHTPTGVVGFLDGYTPLATALLDNSGTASYTTPDLAQGTHAITAVYLGDSSTAGSTSVVLTEAVTNAAPVPQLLSISPVYRNAFSGAFTLTVNGSGLASSTTVQWNGSSRATTYVSSTQLLAAITAADMKVAGTATVTLNTPAPGGGVSNGLSFEIRPVPIITTVAGNGEPGYGGDGLLATSTSISNPVGVALDNAGNLYFTDRYNSRIRRVDASTRIISTVAGTGYQGYSGDGGTAVLATVNFPGGLTLDQAGNIYFSDSNNHVVRRINANSGVITTLAGNGTAGYQGDGGSATAAMLNRPMGLTTDDAGNLYIADTLNHRIRKVSTSGIISTVAGTGVATYGGDSGPAISASLSWPQDVAHDSAGNLYIADGKNQRIRMINILTGVITTVAGDGAESDSGDGGPATSASLYYPSGVTVDAAGNLYISDDAHVVRKVSGATGIITTLAGSGIGGSGGDTYPAASATLSSPAGLAVDPWLNLYIADSGGNRIRKVTVGYESRPGTTTVLTSSANPSLPSAPVTFTASVTTAGPQSPTGRVAFNNGTFPLGTAALNAGIAVFTTSALDPGTQTITAVYSGDAGNPASSASLSQVVNANNPVPVLTSLSATSVDVRTGMFMLEVYGSGFVQSSSVLWNGSSRPTNYLNSSHLLAVIYSWDIQSTGTATVAVSSPAPGGGVSNSLTIQLQMTPVPVLTSISPAVASAGDGPLNLVVTGTDFRPYSGVNWDGNYIQTLYVSRTRLIATIPAASLTTAGTSAVTVVTYTNNAGGGTSNALPFEIQPVPPPVVTSLSPTYAAVGGAAFPLTVNGSSFRSTSVVQWNGSSRATTYMGSSQLMATITAADLSAPGTAAITVFTPSGGTSNAVTIQIITSPLISTVAGNGTPGYNGDGSAATMAELYMPGATAVDFAGNLYIADSQNQRIRRVDALTGLISTVAGTGVGGYNGDNLPATSAQLSGPAGVALDLDGNLYIADGGNNRIRKVDATSGIITTVAGNGRGGFSGDGGAATMATLQYPGAIVLDAAGNLYIADSTNLRVRKVAAGTGIITTIAGNGEMFSTGAGDGGLAINSALCYPSGLALDPAGNLYLSAACGERIHKVDIASGIITTVAGSGYIGDTGDGGPATSARFYYPTGLALDYAGNLYISDNGNQRIRRVDASSKIITTLAGNGSWSYGGDGGPALMAMLNHPAGLAEDMAGNLFIADQFNHRVRKVSAVADTRNTTTTTLDSSTNPAAPESPVTLIATVKASGTPVTAGLVAFKEGSALLGTAAVYSGGFASLTTGNLMLGSHSIAASFLGSTGAAPSTSAPLTQQIAGNYPLPALTSLSPARIPQGHRAFLLTVKGSGFARASVVLWNGSNRTTYYVNSTELRAAITSDDVVPVGWQSVTVSTPAPGGGVSNSLKCRVLAGPIITTVAGNGSSTSTGDNGPATQAGINNPKGVALDGAGNLYIADAANHLVRRVDAMSGVITTIAGTGYPDFSGDNGPATQAGLNFPVALTLDSAGNLFIADQNNERIRRVDALTGTITTVAGNGEINYDIGDGGPATDASLSTPAGVAVDAAGNLYIADQDNCLIRRVDAGTGLISTAAGDGNCDSYGDGVNASAAALSSPAGVALDAASNLYIADSMNNIIRRVDAASNVITTIAGNLEGGYSGDEGPALQAALSNPIALALDSAGNLYISDQGNYVVRKIEATTQVITTLAGIGTGGFSGDGGPALIATLNSPAGLAVDAAGAVYLADSGNNRVRRIALPQTAPVVSWTPPAAIVYGTDLSGVLNATATDQGDPVAGTFTYTANGAPVTASTLLAAGTYTLTSTFTPQDARAYRAVSATAALAVNQAVPVVTVSGGPFTYDGYSHAATCSASVGGVALAGSCVVTYSPGSSTAPIAAGTYTVNAAFSPVDATNDSNATGAGSITINPAILTVTAADKSMTYGGAIPSLTCQVTGLVGTDAVACSATTTSSPTAAGSPFAIVPTVAGAALANYAVNAVNGHLTVNKAVLKVMAGSLTAGSTIMYYGDPLPSLLTYTLIGFVNGDSSCVVTGNPQMSTTATSQSPVGNYPVTITVGDLTAANYTFTLVDGTVTIRKARPTLALLCPQVIYDGNPHSCTGVASGVDGATVTGSWQYTAAKTAVGTYSMRGWFYSSNSNYSSGTVVNTLIIAPVGTIISPAANIERDSFPDSPVRSVPNQLQALSAFEPERARSCRSGLPGA